MARARMEETQTRESSGSKRTADVEKKRILVIDDDLPLRGMLAAALRQHGFQVLLAVSGHEVARRVAALSPTRSVRMYVRWKIASDSVYDAVYQRARGPILDLACGAGVLAAYLRARGCDAPITGIDHDARKIEVAQRLNLRDAIFE